MRTRMTITAAAGLLGLLACSDGSAPSGSGGNRDAALFDGIADSIAASGDGWRAEALRHAAELVRLVGDPTTVTVTIDGQSRQFHAVAEELDVPMMVCHWSSDSGVVHPDSGGTTGEPPVPPGGGGGAVPAATLAAEPASPRAATGCAPSSRGNRSTCPKWCALSPTWGAAR